VPEEEEGREEAAAQGAEEWVEEEEADEDPIERHRTTLKLLRKARYMTALKSCVSVVGNDAVYNPAAEPRWRGQTWLPAAMYSPLWVRRKYLDGNAKCVGCGRRFDARMQNELLVSLDLRVNDLADGTHEVPLGGYDEERWAKLPRRAGWVCPRHPMRHCWCARCVVEHAQKTVMGGGGLPDAWRWPVFCPGGAATPRFFRDTGCRTIMGLYDRTSILRDRVKENNLYWSLELEDHYMPNGIDDDAEDDAEDDSVSADERTREDGRCPAVLPRALLNYLLCRGVAEEDAATVGRGATREERAEREGAAAREKGKERVGDDDDAADARAGWGEEGGSESAAATAMAATATALVPVATAVEQGARELLAAMDRAAIGFCRKLLARCTPKWRTVECPGCGWVEVYERDATPMPVVARCGDATQRLRARWRETHGGDTGREDEEEDEGGDPPPIESEKTWLGKIRWRPCGARWCTGCGARVERDDDAATHKAHCLRPRHVRRGEHVADMEALSKPAQYRKRVAGNLRQRPSEDECERLLLLADVLEDTVERHYGQRCPTCLTRRVLHRGATGVAVTRSSCGELSTVVWDCPCRVPWCYVCERILARNKHEYEWLQELCGAQNMVAEYDVDSGATPWGPALHHRGWERRWKEEPSGRGEPTQVELPNYGNLVAKRVRLVPTTHSDLRRDFGRCPPTIQDLARVRPRLYGGLEDSAEVSRAFSQVKTTFALRLLLTRVLHVNFWRLALAIALCEPKLRTRLVALLGPTFPKPDKFMTLCESAQATIKEWTAERPLLVPLSASE
jgi:hypothetical protein